MSFYRIYRPQVISDIDSVSVRNKLLSLLSKDLSDLPHAYLFSGPRGTGKTTSARLVAKLFNCEKLSRDSGPCGICDQCKSIELGNNLDIIEIDAASNRGIDEIRVLRDRISLTPVRAKFTVYIIDEVHMLTPEAFNALLKTLEEPPKHAVFVLATTDPQKVPVTIKPRCLEVSFGKVGRDDLISALKKIVKKEKLEIDSDSLELITQYADGSYRDAVKALEQISLGGRKITSDLVRRYLTVGNGEQLKRFIDLLAEKNSPELLRLISEVLEAGMEIRTFLTDILKGLEAALIAKVTENTSSDTLSIDEIRQSVSVLTRAYGEMRICPIPQLPLEIAVIELCRNGKSGWVNGKVNTAVIPQNQKPSEINDPPEPPQPGADNSDGGSGLITLERLSDCWKDIIDDLKPYNHSIAGVLRSTRPKSVENGIVTIEAFYKFHQEKLGDLKVREAISQSLKKLFGEKVKVQISLGKK